MWCGWRDPPGLIEFSVPDYQWTGFGFIDGRPLLEVRQAPWLRYQHDENPDPEHVAVFDLSGRLDQTASRERELVQRAREKRLAGVVWTQFGSPHGRNLGSVFD